ncbi:MAG: carboxypeptidase regulatory-like domain-containing protein [Bacteroidales bacterium]|nr:carboxypeptidase regulatory-like domain-containing protein [Bacteroidales bacterium]
MKILFKMSLLGLLTLGMLYSCKKPEEPCSIQGKVIDKETGDAIQGAIIDLLGTDKQITTAQDGSFRFTQLSSGSYMLKAQKTGYKAYSSEQIQLVDGQKLTVDDIRMEVDVRFAAIQGKVTDKKTEKPLAGVMVEVLPIGKQALTAEDGTYRLDSINAGTYTLSAKKEGYVDVTKENVQLVAEQELSMDLVMEEAASLASIQGKVTDKATGAPLSGVTVAIKDGNLQTTTAQDGSYRIDNLNPGTYTLTAQKEGYLDFTQESVVLTEDQTLDLNIEMEAKVLFALIQGKVTDKATGAPLSEVSMEILPGGKQVRTSQDGSYRMDSLTPGTYTLKAKKDGYTDFARESIVLTADQTLTLDIEMEAKGSNDDPENNTDYTETAFGINLEMVYVEGGTFQMGATSEQDEMWPNMDEFPVRTVKVNSYHIGKFEVTQAQWKAVMGSNPSEFKGDNLPVDNITWFDANEFCTKLSEQTGKKYVLPTEAQWEYAARGGKNSQGFVYAGSNNADEVAWTNENSDFKTHPVGTKKANELGLYDMSGNISEWCSDWYGSNDMDEAPYDENDTDNPQGPSTGTYRVYRGGVYEMEPWMCRVSKRGAGFPTNDANMGFRVAVIQ